MVVAVAVEALGGTAALVAVGPHPVEAVDRGAVHLAVRPDQGGELVGERRLPGPVDAVDRHDPSPSGQPDHGGGKSAEHLGAATGWRGWDEGVEATGRHPGGWLS